MTEMTEMSRLPATESLSARCHLPHQRIRRPGIAPSAFLSFKIGVAA
jgi:hypothetical protein